MITLPSWSINPHSFPFLMAATSLLKGEMYSKFSIVCVIPRKGINTNVMSSFFHFSLIYFDKINDCLKRLSA